MSIKAIIGLVVAVAVIGGGAWYFSTKGAAGTGGEERAESDMKSGSGSLADLIKLGGSYECTVVSDDPNASSSGVVVISGENLRGDFESTLAVNGATYESHFIHADGYMYTWSSAMPQGFKMQIPEGEVESSGSTQPGAIDPRVQMDYDCTPTTTDPSEFVPPSNITFLDFSAGAEAGAGLMPSGQMPLY